nr:hypothetical protein [Flavobacterium sp.]
MTINKRQVTWATQNTETFQPKRLFRAVEKHAVRNCIKLEKLKNTFYILFTLFIISSCKPHRIRCGARGICKDPEKQTQEKPEKIFTVKA